MSLKFTDLASQVNVLLLVVKNGTDEIKKGVVYIAQFPENVFCLFFKSFGGKLASQTLTFIRQNMTSED